MYSLWLQFDTVEEEKNSLSAPLLIDNITHASFKSLLIFIPCINKRTQVSACNSRENICYLAVKYLTYYESYFVSLHVSICAPFLQIS